MIWLAFATEFVVMSAVADKKLTYLARHWINLAIILLPLLAFLRGLQVTRLLRLGRLGKALKIYRLRGLSLRAWKGVVTLELLERVLHRSPEARLRHLRRRLRDKEREVARLRRRIRVLEEDQPGPRPSPGDEV
jgi:voltage-gated potassium channel